MRYAIEKEKFYDISVYFNLKASFYRIGNISNNSYLPYSLKSDKNLFDFRILRYYTNGNDEIVEINCSPKNKTLPYFEGVISINTNTYNILKIEGEYFQKLEKEDIAKERSYKYSVSFTEKDGIVHFKDFSMLMRSKVKNMIVDHKTFIRSLKEIAVVSNENLISVSEYPDSLRTKSYDEAFWNSLDDYNYTSGQEEAISVFNKMKRFHSNF